MDEPHSNRPVSDDLHPAVYWTMIALAAWFVMSAWVLFGTDRYANYLEAVVTGLFTMAIVLPAAIFYIWRREVPHQEQETDRPSSWREWLRLDLQTWDSRLRASEATVLVLLPIAAVAFGLTAIGIVYQVIPHPGA